MLLLVVLKNWYGENIITQVNSCITKWPGTFQFALVNKTMHIWDSSCNWSQRLIKFTIIHSLPPRSTQFFHRSNHGLNRHVICIISPHFSNIWWCHKCLKITPGMRYCFCLTILAVKRSSRDFYLVLPTTTAVMQCVKVICGHSTYFPVYLFKLFIEGLEQINMELDWEWTGPTMIKTSSITWLQ